MAATLVGAPLLASTAGASTVGMLGAGGVLGAGTGIGATIGSGIAAFQGAGGLSLLSGAMTASSAFGQYQSGIMEKRILDIQARQSQISARQELLRGKQQARLIKSQLDKDLASQNAIFGARGLLSGEGSADAAYLEASRNATDDINIALLGADQAYNAKTLESQQYRIEGKAAKSMGRSKALSTISTLLPGL